MRHEAILTQKGFLDILRKFHSLSKKDGVEELIVELTDKDVIEKIDVPKFIEELAEKHKVSLQDMITFILKTFVMDWKMGRSNFQNFLYENMKPLAELKMLPADESFKHFEKFDFKSFIERFNNDKGEM